MTDNRADATAHRQHHRHDEKPQAQRPKVAPPLGKSPAEDRADCVKKAQCGGQDQVAKLVEPESLLHEEVQVVKVIGRGDGVQTFEGKNTGFNGTRVHA